MLNKYKIVLILALGSLMANTALAQQQPLMANQNQNQLSFNPAYAGSKDALSVMLAARQQWMGFDGAPATYALMAHTPIQWNHVSLGLSLIVDKQKPVQNSSFFLDYSFRFNVSTRTRLSLGMKGGVDNYLVNFNQFHQLPSSVDESIPAETLNNWMPNVGFGFYIDNPKYYFGFAVPRLLENKFDESSDMFKGHQIRHYYLSGGANIKTGQQLVVTPSVLARYSESSGLLFDLDMTLMINEKLWIGGLYRLKSAMGAMLRLGITPQLSVGYYYEIPISTANQFNAVSHEITLGYEFKFKSSSVFNPRYF